MLPAIWKLKKPLLHSYFELEKLFCNYLEREKTSTQIGGARNKTMTAISYQKNWFTAFWSTKKMDPSYL